MRAMRSTVSCVEMEEKHTFMFMPLSMQIVLVLVPFYPVTCCITYCTLIGFGELEHGFMCGGCVPCKMEDIINWFTQNVERQRGSRVLA